MSPDRFAARRRKLLAKIRKSDAAALLVSGVSNVTYLTGFTGDSSWLLLGRRDCLLISDTRYTTQIEEECPGLDVSIRDSSKEMHNAVAEVLGAAGYASVGFESSDLTVAMLEKLKEAVKSTELVGLSGLVDQLREIKDADEIAEIRAAVCLAERGFAVMRASLLPAMTELEAAHELEHTLRRFGSPGCAFEPIVAVGPRAALPHARPGQTRIDADGYVLVDWGANSPRGYKSDLTRVVATGKVSRKLEAVYGVVLKAQQRAIEKIRPGAMAKDVDAAARKVISDAGYNRYFGHGLGHGIGLDIHEGPRLSPISQTELKPGMVVTVEPGVYIPHKVGVRIEDDVLVTRDGCEVLTSVPKEPEEMLAI